MNELTIQQVMKYTGLSRPTVLSMLGSGKMKGRKLDGVTNPWLVPALEVERVRQERVSRLLQAMQAISQPVPANP